MSSKHPRRRAVLTVAASALILCALLALASRIVAPKNNQAEFGQIDAEAHGVLGEPEDSIDVLVLGDSEAYCAFSPLQLWGEQGITSYVCATSGQPLPYTRSLLTQALGRQHPRVVVLETNCLFRSFTPGYALLRGAQDLFPVLEYHNRWKSLRAEDVTSAPRATWSDEYKGHKVKTDVAAADDAGYMAPTESVAEIPILNYWYVQDIARICRDNGAELLLVSTPSTKNWNTARHERTAELAHELGVAYLDLNWQDTRVAIDWRLDTCDAGDHLNERGAQKTTHALGEALRAGFDVPDHRGDADFATWDDACARYRRQVDAIVWPDAAAPDASA